MAQEVAGVPLSDLADPIREALDLYTTRTDNHVCFDDVDEAAYLKLTPDKPNSARSNTAVKYLGGVAGTLYVIAFAPGDGTGDESAHKLADLTVRGYPRATKIVPRSKAGIHSEAYLPIASHFIDRPNTDPLLYRGSLDELGLGIREEYRGAVLDNSHRVIKIAELGDADSTFSGVLRGQPPVGVPQVRLTVGHKGAINPGRQTDIFMGERYGDPHAIYNPYAEVVQVCGFLAISDKNAWRDLGALRELGAYDLGLI